MSRWLFTSTMSFSRSLNMSQLSLSTAVCNAHSSVTDSSRINSLKKDLFLGFDATVGGS